TRTQRVCRHEVVKGEDRSIAEKPSYQEVPGKPKDPSEPGGGVLECVELLHIVEVEDLDPLPVRPEPTQGERGLATSNDEALGFDRSSQQSPIRIRGERLEAWVVGHPHAT